MICANGRTKPGESIPLVFTFMLLLLACPLIGRAANKEMQIYFIDVEGGQATLFVAPGGKSLLIDTGWPEHAARDADRIVHAAKLAGLHEIDVVLLTHYHDDHTGGVPQLVERIPVHTFIDHGPNIENKERKPDRKALGRLSKGAGDRTVQAYRRPRRQRPADWRNEGNGCQQRWRCY
jgi:beta-lactamase superfamily II metal-dependent hydrolase